MSRIFRPIKHSLPALLLCLVIFGAVSAQTTSFTYQGRLTDAGSLANGPYDIEFKLFDNAGLQQGPSVTHEDVTPVDGSFVVILDFGVVFDGAERFLEIGVRPGDSVGEFTTLSPRWPITSTPYAIRSLKSAASDTATTAAAADIATDATQLGGVTADQYVKTDDPRLGGEGGNFIQNGLTPQAGANFNITGNGVVGGGLGIGIASPRPGFALDVIGTALVTPNSGSIQFGTPNSETGISISRINNRADIRFDGGTLKLVAGPAGGPPSSTNGIAINTLGNVGIGTFNPQAKLHVAGNAAQDRDKGGMVKAMVYVDGNVEPTRIVRCYNGITGASTGNCGFSVNRISAGYYEISFGFLVTDRFVSITLQNDPPPIIGGPRNVGANFIFPRNSTTSMNVNTFYTGAAQFEQDAAFMLIVY